MFWSLVPGIMFFCVYQVCFFGAQPSPCSWQLVLASLKKKRHNPWVFKELLNSNGFQDFEVKKDRTHHQIKMMWTYNYDIFLHYLYLWYTAVGYALHSHHLHLERLNPLSSHVMFHAVPLHPKLQIGSNWYHQWFGLDLRWNVQQETWCQHNFNPESVLNWLVPARDFKIVYIPLFGYIYIYKYGTILSVTYMIMIRYMHSNSVPVSFASQILISNQNQQNPSPGRSSCFISHLNIHKFVKFNGTPTWGTNLWISLEILLTITMSG